MVTKTGVKRRGQHLVEKTNAYARSVEVVSVVAGAALQSTVKNHASILNHPQCAALQAGAPHRGVVRVAYAWARPTCTPCR
jgi:hypothetical protein